MASVRNAAVAGMFYPGDPRALSSELDELLGGVEQSEVRLGFPKALIVPHAGYIYSGPIAARAYDELGAARGIVRRVVMLGPVHRVPVRGLAIPSDTAFATPLGNVPIDHAALDEVSNLRQVVKNDLAHLQEHALEVQLPFLQRQLGEFALVPFAVGQASVQEVAEVIERLWGGPETLIVLSTDLSHYHPYAEAREIDHSTVTRIAGFSTDLDHDEACGATPLNGLLASARQRNLAIKLLAACNSGDTAGGKGKVVGYSAFALHEPGSDVALDDAGKTLLAIARGAIESKLFGSASTADAPWLTQNGATFVTLTRDGALRGCIGSLQAARPLGDDVAQNAIAAAFRDPRFPAISGAEWPGVRVEVSLLSAPKPMRFADEPDLLSQLRAGEDGVILEADGRRATFLPQVWEGIPDKHQFLRELARKASLPDDVRLGRCRVWRYQVIKWTQ
ncbi:MAG TPA: AmmeMemoRadiSam system protein B [Burkholderiales bacterium]|nr:AmmeMemoRadiSam system protein B [Burkholderiales bacterium]